MQNIKPCIWQTSNGIEAASFYCSIFPDSHIVQQNDFIVHFNLMGLEYCILNGGDNYQLNPSISITINCNTDAEVEHYWQLLSKYGKVLMDLNKYPWSEKYGWCADKYGVNWQILKTEQADTTPKLQPTLLFVQDQFGNAKKAIDYYTSVFKDSSISSTVFYGDEMPAYKGKVLHSRFKIGNQTIVAMDGPGNHTYQFNEAFSFIITCVTQEEVDYYWNSFVQNGGAESRCGWCKDQFGVSWQIIPEKLIELINYPHEEERNYAIQAMLGMHKIIIADLIKN